ncbi:hypothetical protein ACCS72_38550, partial [Rhizobium ruizarguesonis]
MQTKPFRIVTRGSPLALAQSHEARDRLMAAHHLPEDMFEIAARAHVEALDELIEEALKRANVS